MKLPRLASFARILLLSLGAAGFVLAAVSLALDVVILGQRHVEMATVAAPAPAGITRWSDLEPENSAAFAAHLRALGCPEATIARLCENSSGEASASAVSEPAREERMASASAREDSLLAVAPVAAASGVPTVTAQSAEAVPSAETAFATAGTTAVRDSGISSGTTSSGLDARAHARSATPGAYGRTTAATGGGRFTGGTDAGATPGDPVIVAPTGNDVKIPLAYQPADPSLTLDETQKAQWSRLQDQFANQVTEGAAPSATPQEGQSPGISTQASVTPDAKTWTTAQISNDEMFRILYGEDAWLHQQVQANLHKSDTGATTP